MKWTYMLFLLLAGPFSFGQKCTTFFSGQFEPLEQTQTDSVYYLFTFYSVYELHATQAYRNIHKIRWYGHCRFDMLFDYSSSETKKDNRDSMHCTVSFVNDSLVDLRMGDRPLRLKKYNRQSLWWLMNERDHELKKTKEGDLKMLEEYNRSMKDEDSANAPVSLKGIVESMDDMLNLSRYQEQAIAGLLQDLRNFDAEHFYANGSSGFKQSVDKNTLAEYFKYIRHVYGKWQYFTVLGQPVKTSLLGLAQDGNSSFTLMVKFEHYPQEVKVTLQLSDENDIRKPLEGEKDLYTVIEKPKRFHYIHIASDDYVPSAYLERIGARFFSLFYNEEYSKIYEESSAYLKGQANADQVIRLLSLINSLREDAPFRLYQQVFSPDPVRGPMISVLYTAETPDRKLLLTVTFTMGEEKNELVGLNFRELEE